MLGYYPYPKQLINIKYGIAWNFVEINGKKALFNLFFLALSNQYIDRYNNIISRYRRSNDLFHGNGFANNCFLVYIKF